MSVYRQNVCYNNPIFTRVTKMCSHYNFFLYLSHSGCFNMKFIFCYCHCYRERYRVRENERIENRWELLSLLLLSVKITFSGEGLERVRECVLMLEVSQLHFVWKGWTLSDFEHFLEILDFFEKILRFNIFLEVALSTPTV